MEVSSQNTWPSLDFDVKEVNRFASRFMPSYEKFGTDVDGSVAARPR